MTLLRIRSAAAVQRNGLVELFTIDDLDMPPMLKRYLGTTNVIDNSHSAVRQQMARVKNWQMDPECEYDSYGFQ